MKALVLMTVLAASLQTFAATEDDSIIVDSWCEGTKIMSTNSQGAAVEVLDCADQNRMCNEVQIYRLSRVFVYGQCK